MREKKGPVKLQDRQNSPGHKVILSYDKKQNLPEKNSNRISNRRERIF